MGPPHGACTGGWDARLTTTALLFVSYIGYLAVRGLGGTHHQRAKRSAVVGLLVVLEILLVHWSVAVAQPPPRAVGARHRRRHRHGRADAVQPVRRSVAFTLLYVWLVMHRSRAMAMEDLLEDQGLDQALAARRARRWRRERGDAGHEDAGFVIGSYVITFVVVGALAWRIVRRGRELAPRSTTPTSTGPDECRSPRSRTGRCWISGRWRSLARIGARIDDRPTAPARRVASAAKSRRRWLSIVVLCIVLVAGGVIVTQFLRSAVDYYCNVDEIGQRSGCDADRGCDCRASSRARSSTTAATPTS